MTRLAAILLLAGVMTTAVEAQTLDLAGSFRRSYNQMKVFVTTQAERMPESDYAFRPSPDVRSFGQLMGHIADYNYVFCAPARGGVNPMLGVPLENTPSKAEILKVLAASFAFCDEVFQSLNAETALEMVRQGQNQVTRAGSLVAVLVHGYEEYGYAAVYARLRGVVPPSTAPAPPPAPAPAVPDGQR